AKGHVLSLDKINSPGVFIYNLGTGRGYSVLEVIAAFSRACKKELPYEFLPRRAGDIAVSYADPSKAAKELGFEARLSLDDMCASLWNWQSKNPNGYK
ncbi:MAG: UDP-glucose 4-epimerase, partial [Clostridia bacterium]|nr:UDP-glucose 4-epimerase [Clostridia bacterium]